MARSYVSEARGRVGPRGARIGAIVERLAAELLSNPLIEAYAIESLGDGVPGEPPR